MDFLKQELAPIAADAWSEINQQAKKSLAGHLTARRFVDLDGPKGLKFAGIPVGRTESVAAGDGIECGVHRIQPLVEVRVPFALDLRELENISRGAQDPDLAPLEDAAARIAAFEEKALYSGFEEACIRGLSQSSAFDPLPYPAGAEELLETVFQGIGKMRLASVEGPYSLVLNPRRYGELVRVVRGYPLRKQLLNLLGGEIYVAPAIEPAFLVSERGGDFVLTLGQDLSVGFDHVAGDQVQMFFTESFTFQVLQPAAVVVLR
ncbi:MAG: bacteriocin family protein [Desulfuromonadaceae bacterium]|nr:bacteriocin family protein [Desulfuromonadaceae bacterium]